MMKKILLIGLLVAHTSLFSQITISGVVTDGLEKPIEGVVVTNVDTKEMKQTDDKGQYSIKANQADILKFTHEGLTHTYHVTNTDKTKVDVTLTRQKIIYKILSTDLKPQNPLLVIDDKISDWERLQKINQEEMEEMQILTGVSATSLYGSRAANGVVLIKTKK